MRRQGRLVRSRTYYILGSNHRIFQNVAARDPRHNSNHCMVVGSLHGSSPREHSDFLGSSTCLPLRPPGRQTRTRVTNYFLSCGALYQNRKNGWRATTHGSQRRRGDSSTRESPRGGRPGRISDVSGDWGGPSGLPSRKTGDGG